MKSSIRAHQTFVWNQNCVIAVFCQFCFVNFFQDISCTLDLFDYPSAFVIYDDLFTNVGLSCISCTCLFCVYLFLCMVADICKFSPLAWVHVKWVGRILLIQMAHNITANIRYVSELWWICPPTNTSYYYAHAGGKCNASVMVFVCLSVCLSRDVVSKDSTRFVSK